MASAILRRTLKQFSLVIAPFAAHIAVRCRRWSAHIDATSQPDHHRLGTWERTASVRAAALRQER